MTSVAAHYVLPVLAVVFLMAALVQGTRNGFKFGPASRTWLIVASIFGAVSLWLWWTATR